MVACMALPGNSQVVEERPCLLMIEGQGRSRAIRFRCAKQANGQLSCSIGHRAISLSTTIDSQHPFADERPKKNIQPSQLYHPHRIDELHLSNGSCKLPCSNRAFLPPLHTNRSLAISS